MTARISRHDVPEALLIKPGSKAQLRDDRAERTLGWDKDMAVLATDENLRRLGELQYKMYADRRYAMLVALQAIDGGGKDSTIRRVFTAFNPQGCAVTSFKTPSEEERAHDYLWRVHQHTPPKGQIAVFNRSHYEDVLVVRVDSLVPEAVWSQRYAQINDFERLLVESGTRVVKIFLHISRAEQKLRFQERVDDKVKQWKFAPTDITKREQWDEYRHAFEAAISRCAMEHAPWYVVPANRKWFRDFAVSQIMRQELEQLPLRWPKPTWDATKIRISD
jgi:PPK2 family polyphosphate:nucleotide phosphotransferase